MKIEPGEQLLHYRLIEEIGRGGMGVVWRAGDTTLEREVALKILPDAFSADAEIVLKALSVDGTGEDTVIEETADIATVMISPDGGWLAYDSNRHGENNVYVKPYPGPGAELRVSAAGGKQAAWSPDGDELYYRRDTSIAAISYNVVDGRFRPGKDEVLFESPLLAQNIWTPLVVLDRRRFLVTLHEEQPGRPRMHVVLNWSREATARLAAQ